MTIVWKAKSLDLVGAHNMVKNVLHVLDKWGNKEKAAVYNEARLLVPMALRAAPEVRGDEADADSDEEYTLGLEGFDDEGDAM